MQKHEVKRELKLKKFNSALPQLNKSEGFTHYKVTLFFSGFHKGVKSHKTSSQASEEQTLSSLICDIASKELKSVSAHCNYSLKTSYVMQLEKKIYKE